MRRGFRPSLDEPWGSGHEVDNVQCQIDSALAGINIIVETIGPWKSIAGSQTPGTRNVRAGEPAANIEQRIRAG